VNETLSGQLWPNEVALGKRGFPGLLAVRTTRPLATMLPVLRAAAHDINPALVVWKAQTMDQLLDAPLAQPRLSALLLSSFSVVALLLSAIGLHGVMAASVRRQTRPCSRVARSVRVVRRRRGDSGRRRRTTAGSSSASMGLWVTRRARARLRWPSRPRALRYRVTCGRGGQAD
jgi:hypothetical protein